MRDADPATRRSILFAAIMLVAMVAIGAVGFAGMAAADSTLTVDGDGNGEDEYESIQSAIDDADGGDTIRVEQGEYDRVVVSDEEGYDAPEDLTIESADSTGDTIISYDADNGQAAVIIQQDGTTLDGFTVERDGDEDNIGQGIDVTASDVTVTDTHVESSVDNNDIGIYVTDRLLDPDGSTLGAIEEDLTGVEIDDNTVSGFDVGVSVTTSWSDSETVSKADITGNTIEENDVGIKLAEVDEASELGTITVNDGNEITDNTNYGVRIAGEEDSGGISFQQPSLDDVTFNENNIAGNGDEFQNGGDDTVDATENWWGVAAGPYTAETTAVTDAKVEGDIDVTPWAAAEIDTDDPDPELTATAFFDGDVENNAFETIEDAIEAASDEQINVGVETVEEDVVIDKDDVTLTSAGEASDTTIVHENDAGTPTVQIDASGVTVDGLTIERTGVDEGTPTQAIYVNKDGNADDVTISNNIVEGDENADEDDANFGIYVDDEGGEITAGVTIDDNEVSEFSGGILVTTGYDNDLDNIGVTDNTVEDNALGVVVSNFDEDTDPDVDISNNDIEDNDEYGVRVPDDEQFGFDKNEIDLDEITVNQNNIVGNGDGLDASGENELEATSNYWGVPNGPSGDGLGDGASVSGDVDYAPWLVEADGDEVNPTMDIFVLPEDSDDVTSGSVDQVEIGIDATSADTDNDFVDSYELTVIDTADDTGEPVAEFEVDDIEDIVEGLTLGDEIDGLDDGSYQLAIEPSASVYDGLEAFDDDALEDEISFELDSASPILTVEPVNTVGSQTNPIVYDLTVEQSEIETLTGEVIPDGEEEPVTTAVDETPPPVPFTETGAWDLTDDDGEVVDDGEYDLVITVEDDSGNTDTASLSVEVDDTAPEISDLEVDGDTEDIETGDEVTVSATVEAINTDAEGEIGLDAAFTSSSETESFSVDAGDEDEVQTTVQADDVIADGEFTAVVGTEDEAGNDEEDTGPTVTFDTTPPEIQLDADNLGTDDAEVTITANEEVSVEGLDIEITGVDNPSPGEPTGNDDEFTIEFDGSFAGEATTTIDVTVEDTFGNEESATLESTTTNYNIDPSEEEEEAGEASVEVNPGTETVDSSYDLTADLEEVGEDPEDRSASLSESTSAPAGTELDDSQFGSAFADVDEIGLEDNELVDADVQIPVENIDNVDADTDDPVLFYSPDGDDSYQSLDASIEDGNLVGTVPAFSQVGGGVEDNDPPTITDESGDTDLEEGETATVEFEYEAVGSDIDFGADDTDLSVSGESESAFDTFDIADEFDSGDQEGTAVAEIESVEAGASYTVEISLVDDGGNEATDSVSVTVEDDEEETDDDTTTSSGGGGGGGAAPATDDDTTADTPSALADVADAVSEAEPDRSSEVDIEDATPDTPGVTVDTSEDSDSVQEITFEDDEVDGSVSISDYSDENVIETTSESIGDSHADDTDTSVSVTHVASISPDDPDQAATVTMSTDADDVADPESVTIFHETDDGWEELPTDVAEVTDEEVTLTAETDGFSLFAVAEVETDETDDEEVEEPEETDDGIPGFGFFVALIALIGAALLAARRQR